MRRGDLDGDGLSNLSEYEGESSAANPDSDGDLISDGGLDPDGVGPIVQGPDPNPLRAAWAQLPALPLRGEAGDIRMAEDAEGRPTVAWLGRDADGRYQIYLLKWFGSAPPRPGGWVELEGFWGAIRVLG